MNILRFNCVDAMFATERFYEITPKFTCVKCGVVKLGSPTIKDLSLCELLGGVCGALGGLRGHVGGRDTPLLSTNSSGSLYLSENII